ncbi:ABC transporter permease [Dietzia cinnamea]|uniref:ABC transporter permease n=1 Tax=Dietzia cinnamea TaxID=321318 RepID=UPI00223B7205|nr:ABC transporter permease [Dietzia cinnamea]MCT2063021.1 ABC transporter permease [Dietzia cinnamea]MCT2237782.1 ABC transporter permease [Dietzia cinnamea]MCT2302560.1 ABC transporter permease [Dietzia cinnamea]
MGDPPLDGPPVIRRLRERRAELTRLTARRALTVPVVVFAVTLAAFALAGASPLNPLTAHFGSGYERMTAADRAAAASALGTDLPWWQAWLRWIAGLATGDGGYSPTYRQPVVEVLAERIPWTVGLSAAGVGIALVVVVISGLVAAWRPHGTVDRALAGLAVALSSVPTFALALGSVAVFAVALRWLPVAGAAPPGEAATIGGVVRYGLLPACVLAAGQVPWLLLAFRRAVTEAADSPPVAEARARGLSGWTVLTGHVAPVAWAPLIALVGARVPEVMVGSLVVETVFAWPGLAAATVDAALGADFALLAAVTVAASLTVLAGTWLADCLLLLADPRVRIDA